MGLNCCVECLRLLNFLYLFLFVNGMRFIIFTKYVIVKYFVLVDDMKCQV